LSRGIYSIEPAAARSAALVYLRKNLQLDENNMPKPGSFLKNKVDLLEFVVINEDHVFPYNYQNSEYDYSVILHKPSVIMIIRVVYPAIFQSVGPIAWEVKGAAELVLN